MWPFVIAKENHSMFFFFFFFNEWLGVRLYKLVDFVRGKDTCVRVTDTCTSCMTERESEVLLYKAKQFEFLSTSFSFGLVRVCG
jgi:hypothetical protein